MDGTGLAATDWVESSDNDLGLPAFWTAYERAVTAPTTVARETALTEALLALGGIRLVVAASDGDRAREVLGILGKGSSDEETEPEGMALLREGDAWMRRAAFSAGFGTIVPVVMTAYSIGILATQSRRPMTDRGRRLRAAAVVFNAAAVAVVACLLWIRTLPQAPL